MSSGATPSVHRFPRSCYRVALTQTLFSCAFAVSFQTMLSQDQMLNDPPLAAPGSEDWR